MTLKILEFHAWFRHAGTHPLYQTMINYVFWENLQSNIYNFVTNCIQCSRFWAKPPSQMYHLILPKYTFHTISIAYVGPLPKLGPSKCQYIIVAIEHLNNWIEAQAVPAITGNKTDLFVLEDIIGWHGCLPLISLDNGSNFVKAILP